MFQHFSTSQILVRAQLCPELIPGSLIRVNFKGVKSFMVCQSHIFHDTLFRTLYLLSSHPCLTLWSADARRFWRPRSSLLSLYSQIRHAMMKMIRRGAVPGVTVFCENSLHVTNVKRKMKNTWGLSVKQPWNWAGKSYRCFIINIHYQCTYPLEYKSSILHSELKIWRHFVPRNIIRRS